MPSTTPLFPPARRNQLPSEDCSLLLAPTTLPASIPGLWWLPRSFCRGPASDRRPSLVQCLNETQTIWESAAPNYCPTFESELSLVFTPPQCIYKDDTTTI